MAEILATLLAVVRPFARVNLLVRFEVSQAAEALAALGAAERPLAGVNLLVRFEDP